MPILTMFELHGDPDETLATQEERIVPRSRQLAADNGEISQTVVRTDHDVLILNLWETEAGMRKVAEEIAPLAAEAGLEQVGWRQYEVLRQRTVEQQSQASEART